MNITRRFFIGGAAAGAGSLAAGCGIFRSKGATCCLGAPKLRFGVVSDIHVHEGGSDSGWGSGDTTTLVKAFEWFRDQGVDAVMICGDMADRGLICDLRPVGLAWDKVFPGNLAPDGRHVEKVFVYGNHDWEGFTYGYKYNGRHTKECHELHIRSLGMKKCWEEVFHEEYTPIYSKIVKGYRFIGSHFDCTDAKSGSGWGMPPRIKDYLAEHGKEIDPSLPFFYVQHEHPKDTCYGPWAWGHDRGVSTAALSAFPNAVAFSGHSHYPITDETSIWQGAFTSIGAGSLRYPGTQYNRRAPEGYENDTAPGNAEKRKERDAPKVMKNRRDPASRYGILVSVYCDRIVYARREFIHGIPAGDDWVMPLPAAESRPFAFAERAKKFSAPQFPAGAVLKISKVKATRRDKKETDAFQLDFPAAVFSKKARVTEYEISAKGADGKTATKWISAPGASMPEGSAEIVAPVTARVAVDAMPSDPEFSVTPVSCYYLRGRPLSAKA